MAQVRRFVDDVFQVYHLMDIADKKQIVNRISPAERNIKTGDVSL